MNTASSPTTRSAPTGITVARAGTTATMLRRTAALALLATGVIQFALIPEYWGKGTIDIGAQFAIGGAVSIVAAVWLWAREGERPWLVAVAVSAVMFVRGLPAEQDRGLGRLRRRRLGAPRHPHPRRRGGRHGRVRGGVGDAPAAGPLTLPLRDAHRSPGEHLG